LALPAKADEIKKIKHGDFAKLIQMRNDHEWSHPHPMISSMDATLSPDSGKLHHIGFIVASISESVQGFIDSLQAEWDGKIFHDPNQVVRVTFLKIQQGEAPLLELVEPAGEKSPVNSFLQKGGGLHHVCYEVENLEQTLAFSRSKGAIITRRPMPAVAFAGRRIAWVYMKSKLLVEYLER
jgi:methylmalonyl-CoA/ethylmalonyl-CoA epimerase